MRRNTYTTLTLLLILTVSYGFASALSATLGSLAYVYRIKSDDCTFAPTARRQTGFQVQGISGIVTALHGVADCKTISAVSDDGQEIYLDLTIQQVDIAHDTALLSSSIFDNLPSEGLVPSPLSHPDILTSSLHIVGYPLGLDKQDADTVQSVRDIESLDAVIPDEEEPASFVKRRSPDLAIDVINMQVSLLPGHSGAPILDDANRIVGIGNGGLRGGTVARSWAILWHDLVFQSVELPAIKSKLGKLTAKNLSLALAFSSTFPNQNNSNGQLKTYVVQVMDASNQPIANAEVLLTHSAGYEIGVTDSQGFYTFQLSTDVSYEQSRIQVEAIGVALYTLTVHNVLNKIGPEIIRLPAAPPTPSPQSIGGVCEFAFSIFDKQSSLPIEKANLTVNLGSKQATGITDSNGYYSSKLPCADPANFSLKVRVTAQGYQPHSETVEWIGETKEIYLASLATPTSTAEPTPTPTPLTPFDVGDCVEGESGLRLRTLPGVQQPLREVLEEKEDFMVLKGPEYVDEYSWWKLGELDGGSRGWSAYIEDGGDVTLRQIPCQNPTPLSTVNPGGEQLPTVATPPVSSGITIVSPKQGDSIIGPHEVRWRYSGQLAVGQGFDLILRYPKEPKPWGIEDAQVIAQKLKNYGNGEYGVTVNFSHAESVKHYCDTSYLLSVVVVQLNPYQRIGPQSVDVGVNVQPFPGTYGCK